MLIRQTYTANHNRIICHVVFKQCFLYFIKVFKRILSAMMLEYMDVMDIVVSDVLKIVYAQIFALLMNLLNVLF